MVVQVVRVDPGDWNPERPVVERQLLGRDHRSSRRLRGRRLAARRRRRRRGRRFAAGMMVSVSVILHLIQHSLDLTIFFAQAVDPFSRK